ncbi:MAG: penicillin-binding protein [Cytophagales bacterium]|nr:penicillin-binding protein [Cytophagales bacterium]
MTFVTTLWLLFLVGVVGLYFFVYSIAIDYNGWYGKTPSFQDLERPESSLASELYSADTVLLGKYFRTNRDQVAYEEISQNVKDALFATEDIRFYEHDGVDLKGTFAIVKYLVQGKKRGSSTITQQLAKNLFGTRSYTGTLTEKYPKLQLVVIKIKEWITAVRLEQSYTKQEILTMYLNTVDFGSNSFGIRVAAKTFFGVDQKDLSIQEASVLVGLLKATNNYSPVYNPEKSLERRNTVLDQLHKYNYLSATEKDSLQKLPIELRYNVENHYSGIGTYFRKEVSAFLRAWCKKYSKENNVDIDLYASGLKVYTTIDSRMQKYAEEAVEVHMSKLQEQFFEHWKGKNPWRLENNKEDSLFMPRALNKLPYYKALVKKYGKGADSVQILINQPKKMKVFSYKGEIDTTFSTVDSLAYYKHFLHTGFLSMDPYSGEIKAWVGGIEFEHFQYDHVRQGKRQPGSTFKPIVYATVLGETHHSPCYRVVDAPVSFKMDDEGETVWTPQNAEGKFSGDTMTLRQAMARSVNSITAYMMREMGKQTPQKVVEYARRLGIKGNLEPVPSLCLGVFDVSLYEMVGAYGTFVNKGVWTKPSFVSRIEDKHGNILVDFSKERVNVMNEETAYAMLHMLMGATQEKGGTGLRLYRYKGLLGHGNEVGGKTGTTQNYSDGWFMGVTPQLVSGCWVGGDHRSIHFRSMKLGQGASMALPVWAEYMKRVYADSTLGIEHKRFDRPESIPEDYFDCSVQRNKHQTLDSLLSDTTQEHELHLDLSNDHQEEDLDF